MKEWEFREARGFCRLCGNCSTSKMVIIPFRYSGKSAPIILCVECISTLNIDVQNLLKEGV